MKKFAKLFVVALMFVLVTGCGGKKITCTYTTSDSYYGKDNNYNEAVTLDKKIVREYADNGIGVVKYTIYSEQTYNQKYLTYLQTEYKETINDLYKDALESCDKYNSASFVTCKVKLKGKKISQTITYNLKGMTKDSLEKLYDDDAISYSVYSTAVDAIGSTYDKDLVDTKEPSNQYTCK